MSIGMSNRRGHNANHGLGVLSEYISSVNLANRGQRGGRGREIFEQV